MTFDHWLAFAAASVILLAIPGPTIVLVISYALGHGRRVAGATPDGLEVELSEREASLLGTLMAAPKRVFSRARLLESVFDGAESAGAVDLYVHYLRRKLGKQVIRTVHGTGYRFGLE